MLLRITFTAYHCSSRHVEDGQMQDAPKTRIDTGTPVSNTQQTQQYLPCDSDLT
jgi:hypothetical protein